MSWLVRVSFLSLCQIGLLTCVVANPTTALADDHEEEATTVAGEMIAVTVFQGQALVTRQIELDEAEGLVEVIVEDLPERIIAGSLYAEPADGVEVRSVRYRVRPIVGDSREEVRKIDEAVKALNDKIREIDMRMKTLHANISYLTNIEKFTAGSGKQDLQRGVLDAAALIELSEYAFKKRQAHSTEHFHLTEEKREIQEEIKQLQKERALLSSSSQALSREAVIFLNASDKGAAFRLNYLVTGANWSPSYNLRANDDQSEVTIEYNASVTQTSGEDWLDVAMTLSTASPSFAAKAPSLQPFKIRLAANKEVSKVELGKRFQLKAQQQVVANNRGNGSFYSNSINQSQAMPQQGDDPFGATDGGIAGRRGSFGFSGAVSGRFNSLGGVALQESNLKQNDDALNKFANSIELYDLSCPISERELKERKTTSKIQEGMSVVYKLANTTSLPSRPDTQLIQITSIPVEAESYRLAQPVLTNYVYREAKLTNSTGMVLLSGPAATFMEDRFVGRGVIPSVAVGQSFTVGLGIDESLNVSRELADRTEKLQGANRIVTYKYDLQIENYGDKEVDVRLMDRIPTGNINEVKIALADTSHDLSENEDYLREQRGKGILRWDLAIPAGASGKEQVSVEYSVQMEHDKNLVPVDAK